MNNNKEFVFYHIERCGGTSLRRSLYDYFSKIFAKNLIFMPECSGGGKINYLPHNISIIKENPLFDFDNIKVILSHTRYNNFSDLDRNCKFKITCIREPISRVISHYYYFDYKKTGVHFIDLPENEFKRYCTSMGNHISNCFGLNDHNKDTEITDKRLKEFSYIALIETFEDDLLILNELLNKHFNKNFELLNIKINERKNKQVKEQDLLKKKIAPHCQGDIFIYNRVHNMKQ